MSTYNSIPQNDAACKSTRHQESRARRSDWEKDLHKRGILEIALKAGWFRSDWNRTPGLAYYLHDEYGRLVYLPDGQRARRWRNLNSSATDFRFGFGYPGRKGGKQKPSGIDFYHLPGVNLPAEIGQANGVLILACGETDMLTHVTAGSNNVTSLFGEKLIPANFVPQLRDWNAKQVRYYPDNDTTGKKAVGDLAHALHGSGIELSIFELPKLLEGHPIKDINDVFVAVEKDTQRFHAVLSGLDEMALPNIDQRDGNEMSLRSTDHTSVRELPEAFFTALEDALGIKKYKANGWSEPVACPFEHHEHDSTRPAGHFHREMHIFRCFKCGRTWLSVVLGEALGLNWQDFTQRNQRQGTKNGGGNRSPRNMISGSSKPRKPTHDEIGDALIARWDGNVAYFYERWHRYEQGWWRRAEDVEIQSDIWETVKTFKSQGIRPTKNITRSVADYLKGKLFVPNQLINGGQHYVNLKNGLFNLETGELRPHNRELFMTSQLDFAYDPDAQAPVWQECLRTWLVTPSGDPDEELIRLIQEAFGYSLTTDTRYQVAFILQGEAASGKSTVINTLRLLLGNAATSLDLSTLSRNPYQLADIQGMRAVTCTEAPVGAVLADAKFKELVSADEMVLRQIFGKPFRVKPTAKVWWALNEMPRNVDRSDAIYRRLKIIPFNNPLPPEHWDRQLSEKLLEEIPGIFNWAVEGWARLKQQGDFTSSHQVDDAVSAYRAENDLEARFVDEQCTTGNGHEVKASRLYKAYRRWCRDNGYADKSSVRVARDWERLGFKKEKRRDGNYYLGVCL